jgi:hypothetical protein
MSVVMNGTEEQQFSMGPETILTVRAFSGSVKVRAGDEGRVSVRGRGSDDEEQAFSATQDGNLVAIRAENADGDEQDVDLDIVVPRGCGVHVSTTDGDIVIDSTGGTASAETEDGMIRITGVEGGLTIKSADGDVLVRDASGECSVTADDGTVKLQSIQGTLVALLGDGELQVWESALSSVTARVDDGSVRIETTLSDDGRYVITTQDGDVLLRGRGGSGGTIHLQSAEGEMHLQADGDIETLERTRDHWHARFGDGRATILLDSREGDVRLVAEGASMKINQAASPAPPVTPTPPAPPSLPILPDLPNLPDLPDLPDLPALPDLSQTPEVRHAGDGSAEEWAGPGSAGSPASDRDRTVSVLAQLERGEITVEEAMGRLGDE